MLKFLTQRNSFRSVLIITQDPLYGHGALDAVSFAAKLESVGRYRVAEILPVKPEDLAADCLLQRVPVNPEDSAVGRLLQKVHAADTVILYELSPELRDRIVLLLAACPDLTKEILFTPGIGDIETMLGSPVYLLDNPMIRLGSPLDSLWRAAVKRSFDIVMSLLLLVILSPLMLFIVLLIKKEDHGRVFFRQRRYTKDGKVFDILKFRTMSAHEENGAEPATADDPRITRTGRVLRRFRLDELPQIINILKGEMSFVGPRPEWAELSDLYVRELPEFRLRLGVKGGLTGMAQVYGRYDTSPYDKLRYDLLYIRNWSFLLDAKLLLMTITALFRADSTEGFDPERSFQIREKTEGDRA